MTTYHETTLVVTILHDTPYTPSSLQDVVYEITTGGMVGDWDVTDTKEITPLEMAGRLLAVGSEPGYFGLDDNGGLTP